MNTNKKSTVLFILHLPPPVHGASMIGKGIQDSQLINNEFNCHYINLALAKDLEDIGKGGIRKLRIFFKLLSTIRKEIKRVQPQICYVTPNSKGGAFYKDFVVVMALKFWGQKVVVHYHNKGVSTRQDKKIDDFLYKRFFKKLKVILLAENLYHEVIKYVDRKDVFICPNGIVDLSHPVKNKNCHKNEVPRILFLSNMMEEKGVWDLLEACRILKNKGKRFYCDFVGGWSDISEDKFKKRVEESDLGEYVTSHGAKYGIEKNQFLEQADLLVFPTYYHNECFPVVLLEAMQFGLPVISTNEGGIPAIIENNKTGYIVPKKDAIGLSVAIEKLLEDQELCTSMGRAGYERFVNNFTLNHFEKKMVEILNSI